MQGLIVAALAFLPGCGTGPAKGDKAADQRVEELKTDIMTQMDRNKDFHIRNKDKLRDGSPVMGAAPTGYGQEAPAAGAARTGGPATDTPAAPSGAPPTGAAATPAK